MAPYTRKVLRLSVVFVFQTPHRNTRSMYDTAAHEIGHTSNHRPSRNLYPSGHALLTREGGTRDCELNVRRQGGRARP